jgi:hypothetical protein
MSGKNQELTIKFNGVQLSDEASARIQNGINNLILQELAGHQPTVGGSANAKFEGDDYCGVYIPHKWIGREIIRIDLTKPASINRIEGNLGFIAPLSER